MLVGGLVAFGAYKMSKKDADRIEQHTGTDPEELTDDELGKAMTDLDIQKQTVTDADREEATTQQSPAGAPASDLDQLERLAKLRDDGVLTQEEFEAKKQQILET